MSSWLYQISPARAEMPVAPTPEEQTLVSAHFEYLSAAYAQGTVTWVARTLTVPYSGLAVVEAADEAAAASFLGGDPAVAAGAFVGRIQPLSVVFAHRGAP